MRKLFGGKKEIYISKNNLTCRGLEKDNATTGEGDKLLVYRRPAYLM